MARIKWERPNETKHFAVLRVGLLVSVRCTIYVVPKGYTVVPFVAGYRAVLEYLDLRVPDHPDHRVRVWVGEASQLREAKREAERTMKLAAKSPEVAFPRTPTQKVVRHAD